MNCKPGDLAMVVRTKEQGKFLLGLVGEVLCAHADPAGPAWVLRFPHEVTHPATGERSTDVAALDAWLRPLRALGDDAVDESVAWLPPVPLPVIDPALLPEKAAA